MPKILCPDCGGSLWQYLYQSVYECLRCGCEIEILVKKLKD